jgi:alpha/beta superfamily hydrolase
MKLIICISGDGGGSSGPAGTYDLLKTIFNPTEYQVCAIDTQPHDIEQNCDYVCHEIERTSLLYQSIFVVGWSLGTVIAVNIAHRLTTMTVITGLILISPIRQCLVHFKEICVPIGFIHGQLDQISPWNNSQYLYEHTYARKSIQVYANGDHYFTDHRQDLAITIYNMIHCLDPSLQSFD